MNFSKLTLIPAIACLLFVPACGAKKSKKRDTSGPTQKVEYFVHGNPLTLIQGSTQNKTSFLKVAELDRYKNFTVSGFTMFVEKSEKDPPSNWDDVENKNSTESEEAVIRKAFELSDYQFNQISSNRWSYQSSESITEKLEFTESNGILSLTRFDGFPVEVQHYSLKKDGTAFSLLFTTTTQSQGRVLINLSFASNADIQPLEFAAEGYSFLFGNAVVPWKEPLQLQACGQFTPQEKASIQGSMDAWYKDAQRDNFASGEPVSFSFTESYAPFSDLNQQCIHLVYNFKAESSDDFYIAGLAASSVNTASKALIDSDIFLFLDHFPVRAQLTVSESKTLIHEIGHYLGLGHEFRKDESNLALHPSIMGYSKGTTNVSSWDFEAIRKLYGAPLQPAAQL